MATVNTIQGTLNWCAAFILNRPSINVAQNYQEPALTIANLIMSTVLGPPFAWQWNRAVVTFPTVVGQADYTISVPTFGWMEKATTYISSGSPTTIELEVVNVLAAAGNNNPPFKIAPQADNNAGNITFRLLSIPDQIYTVTVTYQQAPIPVTSLYGTPYTLTSVANSSGGVAVYTGTIVATANSLAGQYFWVTGFANSLNNGLYYCTANNGTTTITLQNPNAVAVTAAGAVAPATTWAPIPDKFNFLYNRGMLAHLHGMYDNATYIEELSLFFKQLVGCSEGLSDTAKAIFLEDSLALARTTAASQAATTGTIKRGA